MKIIVCIKQVPDTDDIKWTENNTMQREGVESIINPCDLYAMEEALKIKKSLDNVELIALTMGPLQAQDVLKRAIALGFDKSFLLTDKKFAGADTYATGKTIAAAIKSKLGDFDLILCGQYAIDGDTAQTGPSIASQLGIAQITFVQNLEKVNEETLQAVRITDEGVETVKGSYPLLVCVLKGTQDTSRPLIDGIKKARQTEIEVLTMADIDLDEAGIKASPTYVSKAFRPEHNRGECVFCEVDEFAQKIRECANG